ncbi:MAG TPA: RsmD family RNA methyltransferase [Candidatus Limnocylindrales bacterium]
MSPAAAVADAGRVIAGSARGIRLRAPGPGTRPLNDRAKQVLFAILDPILPGARVLDLFAGSGAAGIEALSRGAARAIFVERDPGAIATIERNLAATGLSGSATVIRGDALDWLARDGPAAGAFDVAIVDPPYAETTLLTDALGRLADERAELLANDAWVVAKHFWRDPAPDLGLLASVRERRIGETALTFYRTLSPGDRSPNDREG